MSRVLVGVASVALVFILVRGWIAFFSILVCGVDGRWVFLLIVRTKPDSVAVLGASWVIGGVWRVCDHPVGHVCFYPEKRNETVVVRLGTFPLSRGLYAETGQCYIPRVEPAVALHITTLKLRIFSVLIAAFELCPRS